MLTLASILAIGTEITDGQIANSNAQWLSRKLQDLNIQVVLHLAVPDEPKLIKSALALAAAQSQLIFICGGLGPTSDDITRNVLSDYLSVPLELSVATWQEVQEKLHARNVIVRDAHKQQCFFPASAQVLTNSVGVAPGFYIEHNVKQFGTKHFWVLPGPPIEIESIWQNGVDQQLKRHFSVTKHLHLTTWLCLGAPESELAHMTETFFQPFTFEKKLGYRLQVPYVEIKLWHEQKNKEVAEAITQFTQKLGDFYIDTDLNSINQKIVQKLKAHTPILVRDASSTGGLLTRLTQAFGAPIWEHGFQYHLGPTSAPAENSINSLSVKTKDKLWQAQWHSPKQNRMSTWEVSSPSSKSSRWREPFLVEKLILEWMKEL
jgi:nicotinamide-nucleotide amidase